MAAISPIGYPLSPRFGGEVGNATQMMLSFLLINLN